MVMQNDIPVDGTIWTKEFWVAALERAIRTAAIAASLVLIGDAFETLQVNAFAIEWVKMLGFALGGFILSILMSVGANAKHGQGPSIGPAETVQRPPRRALPEPEKKT